MFVKNYILGVGVTNETEEKILEYVVENIEQNTKKYYITTPNPEILVYATKNPDFKKIINEADIALCDGVGLILAGQILNKPFKERVTGVDLMEKLCEKVAKKPITVGFLGGRGRVAELSAQRLKNKFPDLQIVFAEAGNPDEKTVLMLKDKIRHTTRAKVNAIGHDKTTIDILFVAFGFPKQEEWIAKHLGDLSVRYAMTVGGSFDYVSGSVPRAPRAMRELGIEWLFRLVKQPWRIKRQLALIEFIFLIMKAKFSSTLFFSTK